MPVPLAAWSDPQHLTALAYQVGDATILALSESLDAGSTGAHDDSVADALGKGRARLVLDLHQLRRGRHGCAQRAWGGASRRGTQRRLAGRSACARATCYQGLRLHPTVRSAVAASDYPDAGS